MPRVLRSLDRIVKTVVDIVAPKRPGKPDAHTRQQEAAQRRLQALNYSSVSAVGALRDVEFLVENEIDAANKPIAADPKQKD